MTTSTLIRSMLFAMCALLLSCHGVSGRRTQGAETYPSSFTQSIAITADSEEAAQWAAANPRLEQLFAYLKAHDLNTLSDGRYEIDGDNLFLILSSGELRSESEAKLEAHDRYIDVQIPLLRAERYGVTERAACVAPKGAIDSEADILFFDDEPHRYVEAQPGELIAFTPEIAHAPMIGSGAQRKAVFKIKCN